MPVSTHCLLLELLIYSNPCLIRLPWADIAATVFANWHCPCPVSLIRLPCAPHLLLLLTCWFSVRYLPLDACASVDVLTLFLVLPCIIVLYFCIIVYYCLVWLHLPLPSTMSTGYFHSPTSLSACVVILTWLVLLICILALYYCITALFPYRLQWVPVSLFSTPTYDLLVFVLSLAGWTIYFCIISCDFVL